jgi:hypothetical protein
MVVGKARSLPPERCFTCLNSSLAYKQKTRLERLSRDKHSSFLRKFVNYGQKKFYSIGPWLVFSLVVVVDDVVIDVDVLEAVVVVEVVVVEAVVEAVDVAAVVVVAGGTLTVE